MTKVTYRFALPRNLFGILLIGMMWSVLFLSCRSYEKLVHQEDDDQLLEKLIGQLRKNPTDLQKIARLDDLIEKAVADDLKTIETLRRSGQPDIWYEVLRLYQQIDQRQQKLSELPDTTRELMRFKPADYSAFIAQARHRASEYHYAMALRLIGADEAHTKLDARQHLIRVNEINPGFRNVDSLLAQITPVQPMKVYYEVINQYRRFLPYPMMEELLDIRLERFNNERVEFHQRRRWLPESDFTVRIYLQHIRIVPEQSSEVNYVETAEIVDGVTYLVDENRNFVYDSLGRKIEQPRFKTIACYVTETVREKAIKIIGKVEIIDCRSGKIIMVKPVEGESVFINRYASFKGDLTALSPDAKALLGTKKEPFPTDEEMMLHAGNNFKNNVGKLVQDFLTQRIVTKTSKN